MSLRDVLFGQRPKNERVSLLSSGQQDLLNDIILKSMAGSQGFGMDEDFFQESFVNPAIRQFSSRIAPQIQQRFIGAGAGRGSNLQDALLRAGADVQGNIDQQRASLLNNALNRQLQAAQTALGTRTFANQITPGTTGLLQEAGSGLLGALGQGIGTALGGPLGGLAGGAITRLLNRGFRR